MKDMNAAAAAAKLLQSCPTLCDLIDGSPPGSPVAGILQARTLEWVAISFANAWKWKVKVKLLSCVRPSATPWTAAFQAPPSMGFSRQEYWSGVPLPSPTMKLAASIYSLFWYIYTWSHEIKRCFLLGRKPRQPRQHIKKQRHYFTNKGPSSQSYGFSSSHVWMWKLNYKES